MNQENRIAALGLTTVPVDVTITDNADATLIALLASGGTVGVAYGAVQATKQTIFRVGGPGDTVDDSLSAAKGGSAVENNDLFSVQGIDQVRFVGNRP